MLFAAALLLIARLMASTSASVSCKDLSGSDLDWWSAYNMPDSSDSLTDSPGYTMAYWDSRSMASPTPLTWQTPQDTRLGYTDFTALFQTTRQLPWVGNHSLTPDDLGYLVVNDQTCYCPIGKTCSRQLIPGFRSETGYVSPYYCPSAWDTGKKSFDGTPKYKCSCNHMPGEGDQDGDYTNGDFDEDGKKYAHVKGYLVFDKDQGFWISHSVPGFPTSPDNYHGWDWFKLGNGQHFHCMTLDREGIEIVATMYRQSYARPQGLPVAGERVETPSYHVPESLRSLYPMVYSLVSEEFRRVHPFNGVTTSMLRTLGGVNSKIFAKSGDDGFVKGNGTNGLRRPSRPGSAPFQVQLWEDVVAPGLQCPLYVETWCKTFLDYNSFDPYCSHNYNATACATNHLCGWNPARGACESIRLTIGCEHNESCLGTNKTADQKCIQYSLTPGAGKDACTKLDPQCTYTSPLPNCDHPGGCMCDSKKQGQDPFDPYQCLKSTCNAEFPVRQIFQLRWPGQADGVLRTVDSIDTHAKWPVPYSNLI